MEQIAATFEDAGVTSSFHDAAADIYRLISQTTLGTETPETIDQGRTLEATIHTISEESLKRFHKRKSEKHWISRSAVGLFRPAAAF